MDELTQNKKTITQLTKRNRIIEQELDANKARCAKHQVEVDACNFRVGKYNRTLLLNASTAEHAKDEESLQHLESVAETQERLNRYHDINAHRQQALTLGLGGRVVQPADGTKLGYEHFRTLQKNPRAALADRVREEQENQKRPAKLVERIFHDMETSRAEHPLLGAPRAGGLMPAGTHSIGPALGIGAYRSEDRGFS